MQTRRQTLKQSAVVAGLLAGTGLFPQYALAFNKGAFDAKSLADALKALADAGERAMKEAGILPHHVEGHRGGTWILQDYGDVVVHLFDKEARAFYDLDRLWEDAKVVDLSQVLQPGE